MKAIKTLFALACLSATSSVTACENWQFIVTAESELFSTTLEVIHGLPADEKSDVVSGLQLKSGLELDTLEIPRLALELDPLEKGKVYYSLTGNVPILRDDLVQLQSVKINDSAPLREGYLNYHQRNNVKYTLYGQKMSCTLGE